MRPSAIEPAPNAALSHDARGGYPPRDKLAARPRRLGLWAATVACAALISSCGAPAAAPSGTAPKAGGGSQPAVGAGGGPTVTRLNMDEIFPPGHPGRELVLQNCVNCHTITPIALARRTQGEWATHRLDHRQRVGALTDAEADLIWDYLVKEFAPGRPIPDLPEELLRTWTSY